MSDELAFIDTNILVYAYDLTAGQKHEIAADIIARSWETGKSVISTQVLQELYVTLTSKIPTTVDEDTAFGIIQDLMNWKTIVNDGDSILKAIQIQKKYRFSFRDSMIIHAADSSGADILLTEDLSHGQIVQGIEIRNPFVATRDN